MTESYSSLPEFSAIYFEDSYVLGLEANDHDLTFRVDLVLLPGHVRYQHPGPQEQHCYRRAEISIVGATSIRWRRVTMRPSRDASDEVDFGSIDVWQVQTATHHIEGDWGS